MDRKMNMDTNNIEQLRRVEKMINEAVKFAANDRSEVYMSKSGDLIQKARLSSPERLREDEIKAFFELGKAYKEEDEDIF